ncbi:MAG: hypothetical protein ACI9JM_002466 [Halioglobus sp.]
MDENMSLDISRSQQLTAVVALTLLAFSNVSYAGAEARGVGNFYAKVAQATTDADRGFDSSGDGAPLASDAFLDDFTSLFASDGKYEETAYRVYLEYGISERIDLLFSLEWKDIEESFEADFPGIPASLGTRVQRDNSGLGDGMLGFKYQLKDTSFPIATDMRLTFPNYSTSVSHLNLETIDSRDDKVPLGDGLYNLDFGLSASVYPMPWYFADARVAYVLSDLEHRDFSDDITWGLKAGRSSRSGFGGAIFADGSVSLSNGSAPNEITQDSITIDPTMRVTVLNDQEFARVGLQAWYNFKGFSIEATLSEVIDGQNTTQDTSFEIALSYQR